MRARGLAIAIALSLGIANAPVRADGPSPPVAAPAPPASTPSAPAPSPALLPEAPPPKPVVKRPIFWIALLGGGAVIAAGITLAVVLGRRASTVTVFPTTE